jgi:hypothetical protein
LELIKSELYPGRALFKRVCRVFYYYLTMLRKS